MGQIKKKALTTNSESTNTEFCVLEQTVANVTKVLTSFFYHYCHRKAIVPLAIHNTKQIIDIAKQFCL